MLAGEKKKKKNIYKYIYFLQKILTKLFKYTCTCEHYIKVVFWFVHTYISYSGACHQKKKGLINGDFGKALWDERF